jgi:hypothetical protein
MGIACMGRLQISELTAVMEFLDQTINQRSPADRTGNLARLPDGHAAWTTAASMRGDVLLCSVLFDSNARLVVANPYL